LRDRFDELKIDALILSSPPNVRYLTGFSGEGWAVIDARASIITDGRYTLRAEREAPRIERICRNGSMRDAVANRVKEGGAKRVGFEADHLTVTARDDLKKGLRGIALVPLKGVLRVPRMIKDANEIDHLREAIAVTDKAFAKVVKGLRPGMTEVEIALEIERRLRLAGAAGPGFPSIVAGGPNSADPHAEPTDRKLRLSDNVKLDFGGIVQGYHADLTRTVFLRKPTQKQREIYNIVREAQLRAIDACRPGAACKEVDAAARDLIKDAGYGDNFSHGLGHGVGLEIHEGPGLGHTSEDTLQPGMLVTVEPGIYLNGWGGVRLEDIVLITGRGHEVVTQAPKLTL
jgi:Xaa-Pro aminopeptidase